MTSLAEDRMEWQRQFPNAVLLAGYGNTLFGVLPEIRASGAEPSEALQYYPVGNRLWFETIQEGEGVSYESTEERSDNCGRLVFSRFDETQMILRALERDQGTLLHPTQPELYALDVVYPGIENPEPWHKRQEQIAHATGLY
jgi:thienamycin biosynthesis protein ThnN